jgi:hypothetical protein
LLAALVLHWLRVAEGEGLGQLEEGQTLRPFSVTGQSYP